MLGLLFGSVTQFHFETPALSAASKKRMLEHYYKRHFDPQNIDVTLFSAPQVMMDAFDKAKTNGLSLERSKAQARFAYLNATLEQRKNREFFILADDRLGQEKSRLLDAQPQIDARKKDAADIYGEIIAGARKIKVSIPKILTGEDLRKTIFPVLPPPIDLSPDDEP